MPTSAGSAVTVSAARDARELSGLFLNILAGLRLGFLGTRTFWKMLRCVLNDMGSDCGLKFNPTDSLGGRSSRGVAGSPKFAFAFSPFSITSPSLAVLLSMLPRQLIASNLR